MKEDDTTTRWRIGLLLVAALARPAAAAPGPECLLDWAAPAGVATGDGLTVTCRDGDPACDADGVTDGACTFAAGLCVNRGGCTAGVLGAVRVAGRGGAPVLGAVRALGLLAPGVETCTRPTSVRIALGRRGRRAVTLRAAVRDSTARRTDRDRLRLVCTRPSQGGRAVVVTTNFETGILMGVGVAAPHAVRRADARINADAVVRAVGDRAYVVNRFLGDNLQVVDPAHGLATILQCTTGPGSNPHDVAVVDAHKAYVTRYGRRELWIVDPGAKSCAGFERGAIDLSPWADGDGIPEMSQMTVVDGRLFVTLERLDRGDRFLPAGPGAVVVIDVVTDQVVAAITLAGQNPFADASGLVREPGTGKLLIPVVGRFYRSGDGGIERIDPATLQTDGVVITEDTLGGDVTDVVLVSAIKGYAIVLLPENPPRNALVAFDPQAGTVLARLLTRPALPDLARAPDGTLWLADASIPTPGIRIFDPTDDSELTRRPIDVGLPPFAITFAP